MRRPLPGSHHQRSLIITHYLLNLRNKWGDGHIYVAICRRSQHRSHDLQIETGAIATKNRCTLTATCAAPWRADRGAPQTARGAVESVRALSACEERRCRRLRVRGGQQRSRPSLAGCFLWNVRRLLRRLGGSACARILGA